MADDEAKVPLQEEAHQEEEVDAPREGETSEATMPAAGEVQAATAPSTPSTGGDASEAGQTKPDATMAAVPKSTASAYKPSYVFLIVVTLVNLVADLWSKHWAKSHFDAVKPGGSRRVVVVEDMMNFIFAKNRGGAWGLLQDETEALRRPFFLIVSVAAIVFIVSLYRKLQKGQTALKWGLPLVLGGALGNLVDRIRYGYVVDFIDIYGNLPAWVESIGMKPGLRHWPTFNVADISICVGVALMAIDMFTSRPTTTTDGKSAGDEAKPAPANDPVEPGTSAASAAAAAGPSAPTDASERA
jgi:signal peptidase II